MATKKDFSKLIDEGAQLADKELAANISSLTTFNDNEILEAINTITINKQDLAKILQIVHDDTQSNEQKAKNLKSISGGLEVIAQVVKKLL